MVTVLTRTIGPTGRDYASFTLAEADVENIGTSADLVANDEAIVFEADAGTYVEGVQILSTLTTDATRQVTYKPAAGSEHGGILGQGVHTSGYFTVVDDHTHLYGLSVQGDAYVINNASADGVLIDSCIVSQTATDSSWKSAFVITGGSSASPCILRNCVAISVFRGVHAVGSADTVASCINMTTLGGTGFWIEDRGGTFVINIDNCLSLSSNSYGVQSTGSTTVTGSNNFGGSTDPFPAALQGSPYPITASTAYDPGTGDFALYVGKNGALLDSPNNDVIDGGVGPASNSDVPTTDILGNARSGATANPGAFEQPQATATITRTIGPSGRDYTTFTLAEADVTNIGASADLVFENEAIVFEADSGSYAEILNVDSTLVSDHTRNVTYRCADRTNRPVVGDGTQATPIRMRDDFTHFDGIDAFDSVGGAYKLFESQVGIIVENCEITSDGAGVYLAKSGVNIGSAAAPCIVRNVVTKARFGVNANGADLFVEVFNCTFLPGTTSPTGQVNYQFFATGSSACKLFNCIVLDSRADRQFQATATVTGSNNIGVTGGTSARLFSTNGVGSELTPTTNTSPGPGDFAIYDAATGALIDSPENDALDQGVGPAVNSDVPTTDILGVTRSGATADPGAFEIVAVVPPTTDDGLPFPSGIRGAALRGLGIRGLAIRGRHLRGPSRQE